MADRELVALLERRPDAALIVPDEDDMATLDSGLRIGGALEVGDIEGTREGLGLGPLSTIPDPEASQIRSLRADLASGDEGKGAERVAFKLNALGAATRTVAERGSDIVSVKDFGAIGDGTSHPLSEMFSTLAFAQLVYPHATSLTDEIDWAAAQAGINYTSSHFQGLLFPGGTYFMSATLLLPSNSRVYTDGVATLLKTWEGGGAAGGLFKNLNYNTETGDANITLDGLILRDQASNTDGVGLVTLVDVSNVLLRNLDIKKLESGWVLTLSGNGIRIEGGVIDSWDSPEFGDGVHITTGSNIIIDGVRMRCSDDCIAITPYFGTWGINGHSTLTEDIFISNCPLTSKKNSLRVGGWWSAEEGGVDDAHIGRVFVDNCGLFSGVVLEERRPTMTNGPTGLIKITGGVCNDDILCFSNGGAETPFSEVVLDGFEVRSSRTDYALNLTDVARIKLRNMDVLDRAVLQSTVETDADDCYFKSELGSGNAIASTGPRHSFADCEIEGTGNDFRLLAVDNGGDDIPYVSAQGTMFRNGQRGISTVSGTITYLDTRGTSYENITGSPASPNPTSGYIPTTQTSVDAVTGSVIEIKTSGTARWRVGNTGNMAPAADNAYDIGAPSLKAKTAYVRAVSPGSGAAIWTSGAGSPEGVVTAPIGSLFTRTDGGANTTLYIKESGASNTGWVAK